MYFPELLQKGFQLVLLFLFREPGRGPTQSDSEVWPKTYCWYKVFFKVPDI